MKKLYPYQLWFVSVFISAPLLMLGIGWIYPPGYIGTETVALAIPFGAFFSLPTLLVTGLIYLILQDKVKSAILMKLFVALLSIAGVWITLTLISGSMAFMMSSIYSASIAVSSLFITVKASSLPSDNE